MSKHKKTNKILSITLGTVLLSSVIPMNLIANAATLSSNNSTTIKTNALISNEYKQQLDSLTNYLNINVGSINQQNLQSKLNNQTFKNTLIQWQFLTQVGASDIDTFAKKDADHKNFIKWVMSDTENMNTYLQGGIQNGNKPIDALEIWEKIWKNDMDSRSSFYLKLAIATSLAHAQPVICWNTNTPIDPVVRYNHFKTLNKQKKLLPGFEKYDVMHLRMIVNSWSSEADIDWAQNYIRTNYPQYLSQAEIYKSAFLVPYVSVNKDGISIQNGNDAFYGKGWTLESIVKNGGVCGNISKFGTQVCQAFGIPAMPVGQPGHCAFVHMDKDNSWKVSNDIFGWGKSTQHGNTTLPWGTKPSYLLLLENAELNQQTLIQSEQLRWLANAMSSTTNANSIRDIAINNKSINLPIWQDKINSLLKDKNTTSNKWVSLNQSIIKTFGNEPQVMSDLLDMIRSKVLTGDKTKLQQYIIDYTNALNSVTDIREKSIAKEIKDQMTEKKLYLAQFSFDGSNAGKLMGIDKTMEYSLDGGKTYKKSKTNDTSLNSAEISSINSTNGILIRVSGTKTPVLIPIAAPSSLDNVLGNDDENLVFGLDTTMEFSINDGATWTKFNNNLPDLSGNVVLSIRKFAVGNTPTSNVVRIKYTKSIITNLIPHSKMSVYNVSSQQDDGGQAGGNAIDGNSKSFWHTKWDLSDKTPSLTIKLNNVYTISSLSYLPRQDGGYNGNVTAYKIYTSMDGVNFTQVASGKWSNDNKLKNITFTKTQAQFVKFEVVQGYGGFASASEINLYQ